MGQEIVTTEQLSDLFARYPRIGALIGDVSEKLAAIDAINADGGGDQEEEVSQQYHEIVDPGMDNLHALLKLLQDLVQQTGRDGADVMKLFERAEDEARELADNWKTASTE